MIATLSLERRTRALEFGARSSAVSSAQDSAIALMIIIDYSLQRFRQAANIEDLRIVGVEAYSGVKLNEAIWSLANQARHLQEWERRDEAKLETQDEIKVLRRLGLDPRSHDAAREFLARLNAASYLDLEEKLISTAHEILRGTGYELGLATAGSFRLDKVDEARRGSS
jgi:hypothetical protein